MSYARLASELEQAGQRDRARALDYLYGYHILVNARLHASCLMPREIMEVSLCSRLSEVDWVLRSFDHPGFEDYLNYLSLPPIELLPRDYCVAVLRRLENYVRSRLETFVASQVDSELEGWLAETSAIYRSLREIGIPEKALASRLSRSSQVFGIWSRLRH